MKRLLWAVIISVPALAAIVLAQHNAQNALGNVYRDESHCLTAADMRGEQDKSISCFCRDSTVMARYVYETYIITGRDRNLNGVYLRLTEDISRQCGENNDPGRSAQRDKWGWYGPEVVRTYPPDEVIKRIRPEKRGVWGRSVPFTIVLVYRDSEGRVTKTETYSSREFIPDFTIHDKR